jgi:tetratricopeptide (TPR) repeat protein
MGRVIALQGDVEKAQRLLQESLGIKERIGDARDKAAALSNTAGMIAEKDLARALELWGQSLEIMDCEGDSENKACTLSKMARAIGRHGDTKKAWDLLQQALEIYERIGDNLGVALTLAGMAWAAGNSGDHPRRDQLYQQAAGVLGSVRAYTDLITVLADLSFTSERDREIFTAQAAWLVVMVQAPVHDSIDVLRLLFNLVPQGDRLQPLLAGSAVIILANRGKDHPQREKLSELAGKLLSMAADNCGIRDPDTFRRWFASNQLGDPAYVFPTLRALLEQLVGDRWLFDRTPLQDNPH